MIANVLTLSVVGYYCERMIADETRGINWDQPPGAWLRSLYLSKREANERYSTRAFARDLGMSQSLLSQIMNGRRTLTYKQVVKVAQLFQWDEGTVKKALGKIESVTTTVAPRAQTATKTAEWSSFDLERFKLVSNWYHIAILDLIGLDGFKANSNEIASILGVSVPEVKDATDRLLALGLIQHDRHGLLKKTNEHLRLPTNSSQVAIRAFHKQMIQKAIEELQNADHERFVRREISSLTLAIDPSEFAYVKKEFKKFKDKLAKHFQNKPKKDLYQFNFQFFPLTQKWAVSNSVRGQNNGRN